MKNQLTDSPARAKRRGRAPKKNGRPLHVKTLLTRYCHELNRLAGHSRLCQTLAAEGRRADVDTIDCFESVLNSSLDAGYRGSHLLGFVYEVLFDRFAARIRRRLATGRGSVNTADVEDLLGVTVEAVHNLISNSNRTRHTVTYALLLAIADHRTIDYLRRKRPELTDQIESYNATNVWNPGQTQRMRPDVQLENRHRLGVARELRTAVLNAVNDLSDRQRHALILVEVEGLGYGEIAARLDIKRTDVGNLVRRARLQRDRNLMPYLRKIESLDGHVGFKRIQDNRALRVNLLRWTTEMGDGVCGSCLERSHKLHTASEPCFPVETQAQRPAQTVLVV
ncbi:MAG: RNA polymerase sigma factor [Myxococcota bacterium]|nr:RNA polymerase sigma factor [Myxococcota bacterium]